MRGQADELATYLRGLPDDWASWLVYADALSERGDPRGQLLVLAHQLETAHAPGDARARLEALEDEWMVTQDDHLRFDDADQYRTFRRLAPLTTSSVPADLASVVARPISQLLALLEPGERGPGLSPVFELQRERVVAALLAWIDRAFDGVSVPDEAHRTIHQAEAADSYEACDRSRDHLGRWQDLPATHLRDNQWALAHLDEQGIHYYTPAVMSYALRPHGPDHWLIQSLEYTLEPSGPDLRDHQQGRFRLLDRDQRAAIYAFTLWRGYRTAAPAWGRVFDAERGGARVDWFELYSPPVP